MSPRTGHRPRCDGEALVEETGVRLQRASIAANVLGAVVVFVFIARVLPAPVKYEHAWWPIWLNGGLLVLSGVLGIPLASHWLRGLWRSRVGWVLEDREPTPSERELTLRFALTQQRIIAKMWLADAGFFAVVNATYSWQIAFNIAITVALGGLVVVSLGFLLSERQLRPITALALASGVPERPQLPGVMARTLLSWTLATGVLLVGLAIVGAGALINASYWDKRTLGWVVLVLALLGLAVGLLAMVGLARSLADPLDALRRAVARVEAGELEHDVTVDDASEVGLLQAGFNRMLAGLRERERLRDLFGRQVGEDVVRHALEHGVELGGQAVEAAVLFVDLKGSTELAEARDPTEVVALLNAFFAEVVDVVAAHQGWVNKFEGDAALCVFGAPVADAACAGRALAAARELAERLRAELPELSAGIGVSAGRVVAGHLGAARRFEYTVIGDAVNEAARLSEKAKGQPGGVLASGAAVRQAGESEQAAWRLLGEQQLRGRSRPTEIAIPLAGAGAGPAADGSRPAPEPATS